MPDGSGMYLDVEFVAITCGCCSDRSPACQGDFVLVDVQYPTIWLPVGLSAAAIVGAAVWPGDRFTRVVVALCLIALVIVGSCCRRSST